LWRKALKSSIAKKRGRTLTIMAIPTGDESVKSLTVPLLLVYVGFAVIASIVVLLTSSYLGMTARVARSHIEHVTKDSYIEQLSKENAVLGNLNRENEKKLYEIKDKLVQLEKDLAYLDSLSGEITEIVKGTRPSTVSASIPSRGEYERGSLPGRQTEPSEIISLVNNLNQDSPLLERATMFSETTDWLDELQQSAGKMEIQLNSLKKSATSYRDRLSHTPRGMPTRGRLTSRYGSRRHPVSGRIQMHEGVDLAAPTGTPIVATADGVVLFSGSRAGYGRTVIINHGYGFQTLYGHASKIVVRVNQRVKRGQVIAYVGSSGVSTGSHLHYEVRVSGKPVNPWSYMN
jgi:murein DD-endopeptidase MepM/ murein hydrolase activator NlpD